LINYKATKGKRVVIRQNGSMANQVALTNCGLGQVNKMGRNATLSAKDSINKSVIIKNKVSSNQLIRNINKVIIQGLQEHDTVAGMAESSSELNFNQEQYRKSASNQVAETGRVEP
jgi:carbonic anhydrase/acetyltransferase-like protein (isoleucine patch superfamily)